MQRGSINYRAGHTNLKMDCIIGVMAQPKQYIILLLIFFLTACATPPAEVPQEKYYLVSGNTLGLREGFLEAGNVVTFSDSSMTVREPSRPGWQASYGFRGDSIAMGSKGNWGRSGDTLLTGPEGNDYHLELLTTNGTPADSILPAGSVYRTQDMYGKLSTLHYFGLRDTTGGGCTVRYSAELLKLPAPANINTLTKSMQQYFQRYRTIPPNAATYAVIDRFGETLLMVRSKATRIIYRVDTSSTTDTLRLRGYSNTSPTRGGDQTAEYYRHEPSMVELPTTPTTMHPVADARLDSISWATQLTSSDRKQYANAPFDFEIEQLTLEYRPGEITLLNGDRQLWRGAVERVAPDLLFAPGDDCSTTRVFPLRSDTNGLLRILAPLDIRRTTLQSYDPVIGTPREVFTTQFRMQGFTTPVK